MKTAISIVKPAYWFTLWVCFWSYSSTNDTVYNSSLLSGISARSALSGISSLMYLGNPGWVANFQLLSPQSRQYAVVADFCALKQQTGSCQYAVVADFCALKQQTGSCLSFGFNLATATFSFLENRTTGSRLEFQRSRSWSLSVTF